MRIGGVFVRSLLLEMYGVAALAGSSEEYRERSAGEIRRVVIHHTAGTHADHTAESIARFHALSNGWPGIGYHFVVHWDGRIEYVGDVLTVRYHCGLLNRSSIGVCLTGCFTEGREPKPRQLMRARMLVLGLRSELGAGLEVVGHKDVADRTGNGPTVCPGDWWEPSRLDLSKVA